MSGVKVMTDNDSGFVYLEFQDFYDMAACLNIALKGAYSQKEVACNAYEYYENYWESYKFGSVSNTIVELAKRLDEASSSGFDDDNCLWWLYCMAKGLKLIFLSLDEYKSLENRIECFIDGSSVE